MPRMSDVWGFLDLIYPPRDADFHSTCVDCGEDQPLSTAARVDGDPEHTRYLCRLCGVPMVDIRPKEGDPGPAVGYWMGKWILRVQGVIRFDPPGKAESVAFGPLPFPPDLPFPDPEVPPKSE